MSFYFRRLEEDFTTLACHRDGMLDRGNSDVFFSLEHA
jgi:hypothetical protein